MDSNDILLSVVIISRNEEKNIARCIESVLKALKHIQRSEVILVDSASIDRTIQIAIQYPIKILQLRPEWPLSPAAGRFIGFLNSRGRYIHFQDGDTTMFEDWFSQALPVLEREKDVAGVVGIITQEPFDTKLAKKWAERNIKEQIGEIRDYHEDILVKREVILKVNPFNPYLKALEEGEFSYRVIASGFKLLRLPYLMSHHLGGYSENFSTMIKRKLISSYAYGQILRYSLGNKKVLLWWAKDYKFLLIFTFLTLFGLLFIIIALLGYDLIFYFWIASYFALFFWILYEKRNIKYALNHFLSIAIRWPFLIWGFLRPPLDPNSYPRDVKVIREV